VSDVTLDLHVRRHVVDAAVTLPMTGPPVTVLFGPSGSGKTTLLRVLAGLDRTVGGHVTVAGDIWDDGHGRFVPARRRQVGLLFQDHALFPHLDVLANVTYGLHALPRSERKRRAHEALVSAHSAHLVDRKVPQLSGGEAQRVALARALAPRPRLLLLDEPLSALDLPTRTRLRTELRRILLTEAVPTIVVTHDRDEALALGDRVVVLLDGTVRQVGPVADVFAHPVDADVARAVGIESALPARVVSVARGIATVRVEGHELNAVVPDDVGDDEGDLRAGDEVIVCIRPEDVAIELLANTEERPGRTTSVRNHLPAAVTSVTPEGPLVRVGLDAGFPLDAFITRASRDDLDLVPGTRVVALFKSPAVHLIRHASHEASVVTP
jgi:molybdate transport system ATP-binding protein